MSLRKSAWRLLRRFDVGVAAELVEERLGLVGDDDLHEPLVDLLDHRLRRAGRHHRGPPAGEVHRDAEFRHGRYVRDWRRGACRCETARMRRRPSRCLGEREYRIVHGVIDRAAEHVVERVRRGLVVDLDGLDAGALVELAHDAAGRRRRGIARLVALLLHRRREIGDGLVRALGIDHQHERLAVDRRRDLDRPCRRRPAVLEEFMLGRNRRCRRGRRWCSRRAWRARRTRWRCCRRRPSLFSTMMVRLASGRSFSAK